MKHVSSNQKKYSDTALLVRDLHNGKEEAFDFLFRSRYETLCRYAFSILQDYDDAEDVVQEVFARIWQKYYKIKPEVAIYGYLYVSVRNRSIDRLKDRSTISGTIIIPDILEFVENEDDDIDREYARLLQSVEELPPQRRRVFRLIAIEGMKYRDAAEKMNISTNTVKTQLKKAYSTLRGNKDKIR